MSDQFRNLMSRLHMAAKTYQVEKVAKDIHRLLQLAKMSEKQLGETISLAESAEAIEFWSRLLGTMQVSGEVACKSARSFYCIVWAACNGVPSLAVRAQAGEYCDWVATVCEHYLTTHTAEVKVFPMPTKKPPPALHLVGGTKV